MPRKEPKPATERTWMQLGATRAQARRLLAIPRADLTDAERSAAWSARPPRITNMWPGAISWLDQGYRVVLDDVFYRLETPEPPA